MAWKRKIVVDDAAVGQGTAITLKQSLLPCGLVTILFFLWGFAYGLLDVLNSHFQSSLHITAAEVYFDVSTPIYDSKLTRLPTG